MRRELKGKQLPIEMQSSQQLQDRFISKNMALGQIIGHKNLRNCIEITCDKKWKLHELSAEKITHYFRTV
jgi:hypothetical protein